MLEWKSKLIDLKSFYSEGFLYLGTVITSALFHSEWKISLEIIEFMMLGMMGSRVIFLISRIYVGEIKVNFILLYFRYIIFCCINSLCL